MQTSHTFITSEEDAKERLDIFLHLKLPDTTRTNLKHLIKDGLVSIGDIPVYKAGHRVKAGEKIDIELPEVTTEELKAEPAELDILFEDSSLIVVNKPSGLSVHPGAGKSEPTLASALLYHAGSLSTIGGPMRPGIVHRLDKGTTGVMVAAKDDETHTELAKQFKAHTIKRRYHAIVWGVVDADSGDIDTPLGRSKRDRKKISTDAKKTREARTHFDVLNRFDGFTLVELTPHTGRTHQLRVHLASIGHPIVGDKLYGKRKVPSTIQKPLADKVKGIKSQCLHALSLGFIHPRSKKPLNFEVQYPEDMLELIEELKRK
ncbi:MAG: RluA family pseudouridine synthase [Thermodesulfobacteriota bacterium]